jgi:hypothetical protein
MLPISYRQHSLSTLETDAVHILGGFLGEFFSSMAKIHN